jgi:hypothetical protein
LIERAKQEEDMIRKRINKKITFAQKKFQSSDHHIGPTSRFSRKSINPPSDTSKGIIKNESVKGSFKLMNIPAVFEMEQMSCYTGEIDDT